MPYLLSNARNRKIGGNMSDRLTKDDRSRLLQGAWNGILLASPFWVGLIYWLTR